MVLFFVLVTMSVLKRRSGTVSPTNGLDEIGLPKTGSTCSKGRRSCDVGVVLNPRLLTVDWAGHTCVARDCRPKPAWRKGAQDERKGSEGR